MIEFQNRIVEGEELKRILNENPEIFVPKGFVVWQVNINCSCHHSGCNCDNELFGKVVLKQGENPDENLVMEDSRGCWNCHIDFEDVEVDMLIDSNKVIKEYVGSAFSDYWE